MPSSGGFREVKNVKIWFLGHNFMANVAGATNTYEAQSRNMIKHCTKYGFDILLFIASYHGYGGNRQHTTYDEQGHGYGISSPQVR